MKKLVALLTLLAFLSTPLPGQTGIIIGFNDPRFAADPYEQFHSYEAADLAADLEEIERKMGPLDRDPARLAQMRSLVEEVYKGLQQQYPRLMSNKAMPEMAIREQGEARELRAFPSRLIKPHGFLVATSAFITAPFSREAKLGFIAHEIAHLYLGHRHFTKKILQVYYQNGVALTDQESKSARHWLQLKMFLGGVHTPEFNGLSFSSDALNLLMNSLKAETGSPLCGESFKQGLSAAGKGLRTHFSELDWAYNFPTPAARADLSEKTKTIIGLIENCLKTLPAERNVLALSYDEIQMLRSSGIEHKEFASRKPTFTFAQFLALNLSVAKRMQSLEKQFDVSKLRTRTIEDQVDEVSVGVLKSMGHSVEPYLSMFLEEIPLARAECERMLVAGHEPPFGSLSDIHHGHAWRHFNLSRFAKQPHPKVDGLE